MADEDKKKSGDDSAKGSSDLVSYVKPVDVNKIRVRVLVICSYEKNFESAVTYLTRRGWQTQITTNVIGAFKLISTFDPNFILLSANIKTNKINMLPNVIYQTFNVPVVLFGENADTLTIKLLQDINANFKMPGIASGPSIHRSIKNILHELSKSHDPIAKSIYEKAVKTIRAAQPTEETTRWKKQKKGYTFSTDDTATDKKASIAELYEKMAEDERQQNKDREDLLKVDEDNDRGPKIEMDLGDDLASLASKYYKEFQNKDSSAMIENDPDKYDIVPSQEEPGEGSEDKLDKFEEIVTENLEAEYEKENELKFDSSHVDVEIEKLKHFIITEAEKCAEQAGAVQVGGESNSSCSLWTMATKKNTGLILVKIYGSWSQTKFFTTSFEGQLKDYLTVHWPQAELGEKIDFDQPIEIKEKVEGEVFTALAGGEKFTVEVKYMMIKDRNPNLSYAMGDKLQIDANDVVVGLPTGADIYIHLPINNKFIRYINDKTNVSGKQKEILKGSEAYIIKEDAGNYKNSYIRNKALEKFIVDPTKKKKSS